MFGLQTFTRSFSYFITFAIIIPSASFAIRLTPDRIYSELIHIFALIHSSMADFD
jgi:hypothetical protein